MSGVVSPGGLGTVKSLADKMMNVLGDPDAPVSIKLNAAVSIVIKPRL